MNENSIIKLLLLHYLIHRIYIVLMKLEKTIFHTSKLSYIDYARKEAIQNDQHKEEETQSADTTYFKMY